MSMSEKFKCEICGGEEGDKLDLEIHHRGCRLSQLSGRDRKLEKELGEGIMALDLSKAKDPELQKLMDKLRKKRRSRGLR